MRYKILLTFCALFLIFEIQAAPPGLKFIENKGQWLSHSYFGADIPGGNFYITETGFSYLFYDTEDVYRRHHGFERNNNGYTSQPWSENINEEQLKLHLFHTEFVGANLSRIEAKAEQNTNYNYYFGNDSSKWVSAAKGFEQLEISEIYKMIDLKVYSEAWNLKYDIIAREGADLSQLKINYRGVDEIYLSEGNLVIKTSINEITEYKPYAYQIIEGKEVQVAAEYRLDGTEMSFDFPQGYDSCYELVIDPLLIFSTYSGSPADNWGNTATYGENGKLYSGGIANHFRGGELLGEFPATSGAFQTEWGGVWDLAVIKYDSAGHNVEYATYLGGSGSEVPVSMIMNSDEELLIYGVTNSSDFPVTSDAYQNSFHGGSSIGTILGTTFSEGSDSFIVKLSKNGSNLNGGTYFGGNGNDGLNERTGLLTKNYGDEQRGEIFIDNENNVYIASSTSSTDLFSNTGIPSFERNYKGGDTDAYMAKFSQDLTTLIYGGYIGGNETETGFAIKVDSKNDVFVAGGTNSLDFPIPSGLGVFHGDIEGWVVRIDEESMMINSGALLGTSSYDQVYFLDIDGNDDVYVLGQTQGDYPISEGVFSNPGGGQFIHKLNNDLNTSIFSTAFGTSNLNSPNPNISPTAFLVNDCNNLYVAGWGNTQGNFLGFNYVLLSTEGLPTTSDAFRSTTTGEDFYLMVLDADAKNLLYGTFFGGAEALIHVDGGTSRFDKRGIVYHSVCASCLGGSSFYTTNDAWSTTNGTTQGCNNAAFKFDLASLRARLQTNNTSFTSPGYHTVCVPDSIVFQNFSIGGEVFEWDFGNGEQIVRTDTAYIVYQYKGPGTYTVTLKAIDPNTCIAEDQTSTVVNVFDPKQKAANDTNICEGSQFQLTATGGTQYTWTSADSVFISNEIRPIVSPEDTTTYFVRISDNNCQTIDTLVVNVIPETEFNYSIEKIFDCETRPTVKVTNKVNAESYLWNFGDGTTTTQLEEIHTYTDDGIYNIKLLSTVNQCVFQRELNVDIQTIKVPNVFTPTDDAYNETFEIISGSKENLKVFNRWGGIVYENDDYQDQWTGEDVAAGIYYYEVIIEDETSCTGWVQVIK